MGAVIHSIGTAAVTGQIPTHVGVTRGTEIMAVTVVDAGPHSVIETSVSETDPQETDILIHEIQTVGSGLLEEGSHVIVPIILVAASHHVVAKIPVVRTRMVVVIQVPAVAIVGVSGTNRGLGKVGITVVVAIGATAALMGRAIVVVQALKVTVMVEDGDGLGMQFVGSGAGSFTTRVRRA